VEHRIAGADANLYLATAAVLGAALLGIERKMDPGAPVEGNGYAQAGERTLPAGWREALSAAEGSQFLRVTLGAEFMKVFLAIKNQECARFSAEVSELDYAWYLRS
jgi:glutamine synthetase